MEGETPPPPQLGFQTSQEAPPLASFLSSRLGNRQGDRSMSHWVVGRPTYLWMEPSGVDTQCLPACPPVLSAPTLPASAWLSFPSSVGGDSEASRGGRRWIPLGLGPAASHPPRDTSPNLLGTHTVPPLISGKWRIGPETSAQAMLGRQGQLGVCGSPSSWGTRYE